jgi:hypothetical protein
MVLAGPADDAALRRLLREDAVAGQVTLCFEREPSYFAAAALQGPFHQAILARAPDGAAVGMASRSVRELWVNGGVQPVGYLSQLRASGRFAWGAGRAAVLGRAFDFVRSLHADGRAGFYLVSIVAGNTPAERLLLAGLPGYPLLHPLGGLSTYAVAARPGRLSLPAGLRLIQGSVDHVAEIVHCLARNGARRQLAPGWQASDLSGAAALPGLTPDSFWLALAGGRVVGCAARWDQRSVKQTIIRGYGGFLRRARPVLNRIGRLGGWPALPPPGAGLRLAYASHIAVDDDDPQVFGALFGTLRRAAAARGDDWLVLGLPAGHPWATQVRRYRHVAYPSRLYAAAWDASALPALADRAAWPEIAVL